MAVGLEVCQLAASKCSIDPRVVSESDMGSHTCQVFGEDVGPCCKSSHTRSSFSSVAQLGESGEKWRDPFAKPTVRKEQNVDGEVGQVWISTSDDTWMLLYRPKRDPCMLTGAQTMRLCWTELLHMDAGEKIMDQLHACRAPTDWGGRGQGQQQWDRSAKANELRLLCSISQRDVDISLCVSLSDTVNQIEEQVTEVVQLERGP
ncbi:hypothetical protein AXG93_3658s1240 [Marchantia polymorpha subsp. ruderalis]|uniref:Uncharacterized protein n=1 Tax=Marchantia polymorpha subsp. ruderalis TaxID=1480154 RepID=A0A176VM52_MARPO|nr:hypothetical protein AXG93_3658s1240 [Marchantia polymorpha subsp. ruderalis]